MLSESRASGEDSRRLEARATLAECLSSPLPWRSPVKSDTMCTSLLAFTGLQEHFQGPVAVSVASLSAADSPSPIQQVKCLS